MAVSVEGETGQRRMVQSPLPSAVQRSTETSDRADHSLGEINWLRRLLASWADNVMVDADGHVRGDAPPPQTLTIRQLLGLDEDRG